MKAIVFDFDGTVLDTESACYQAWKEVYERHGCPLPASTWARVVGTAHGSFDPWADLENQVGHALDRGELEKGRRQRELELVAEEALRPGVLSLLDEARRFGLRVGLATSSTRRWVEGHLASHGILDRFETVATADDVTRLKPDPELYLLAVKKLGVTPEDALAVEDSPTGALAAVRAGLVCVVVPNQLTQGYDFPSVDARLPTLEGTTLHELQALWRRVRGK